MTGNDDLISRENNLDDSVNPLTDKEKNLDKVDGEISDELTQDDVPSSDSLTGDALGLLETDSTKSDDLDTKDEALSEIQSKQEEQTASIQEFLSEQREVETETETETETADANNSARDDALENDIDEDSDEDDDTVDYDKMAKAELVAAIIELAKNKNVSVIKRKVGLIKLAFHNILKHEKEDKLNAFIEQGGDKKDFVYEPDQLEQAFNIAFNAFKQNKRIFEETLEKEKQDNLNKKKAILEEIRKLIETDEDLKKTYDEFKKLQSDWKETGPVPRTETDNLWKNYHFLVDKFLDKVRINEELRDLDRKKNLELCIDLCEKTEALLLNQRINESFKLLQQYHQEWKGIGPLPTDKKDEVWERFKLASDKVIERRKEYYDRKSAELENNYAAKVVLCEKMEEIAKVEPNNNNEWADITKKVTELQNLWKTIGPAQGKKNDEIWSRFRTAINLFFENKKDHYAGIREELVNNYNLKLDICAQAEALKDSKEWRKATMDMINLQKEWKKIGPIPRKHSDELWKRFRGACDYFFDKKKVYFDNIQSVELENLNAKRLIIEKIKNENLEEDKKKALETINAYQREFTSIGHVPADEKDNINRLLREAINEKLDKLQINPVEKKLISFKSKFQNMPESADAKDIVKNEIWTLNNKLTQIKSEILLWENNIGFFAASKSANLLKKEFEDKIEKAKAEMQVIEAKLKFLKQK